MLLLKPTGSYSSCSDPVKVAWRNLIGLLECVADVMEKHPLQFKTFIFHNINLHVIQLVILHVYCACKWCNPPLTLVNHLQSISLPPFSFLSQWHHCTKWCFVSRQQAVQPLLSCYSQLSPPCPMPSALSQDSPGLPFCCPSPTEVSALPRCQFSKKKKKGWKNCSGMTVHPCAFCDISRWPETVLDKPSKERTNKDPPDGKGTWQWTLINVHPGCAEKQLLNNFLN